MFFGGANATGDGIGLAASSDGLTWTEYAGNPILRPSTSGWDDATVEAVGGVQVSAAYGPCGTRAGARGRGRDYGVATSSDGRNWTNMGQPRSGAVGGTRFPGPGGGAPSRRLTGRSTSTILAARWAGPSGCASRFRSTATRGRSSGQSSRLQAPPSPTPSPRQWPCRKRGSRAAVSAWSSTRIVVQRADASWTTASRGGISTSGRAGRSRSTPSPMTRPRLRAPRLNSPSARPPMGSCTRPSRTFQQKPWWARRRPTVTSSTSLTSMDVSQRPAHVLWNAAALLGPRFAGPLRIERVLL